MALQQIDINTLQPNGKSGESTRSANIKINANTTEIGQRLEALEADSGGAGDAIDDLRSDLQQEVQARENADAQMADRQVQAEEALQGLAARLLEIPGRNLLINCGIPINQRVFAGGSLAAGAYGYDRWKAGPGGGSVVIDPVTGQFNHSSGPLVQVIESPAGAWGQPLFVSVENPSGPVQVSVGGATGTITAGAGRRGVQLTPSGSGHMVVQLTATGVTYRRPKVERGTSTSSFEFSSMALEIFLCQRFYEKSYNLNDAPGTVTGVGRVNTFYDRSTTGTSTSDIRFRVTKRAVPAMTIYSDGTGEVNRTSGNTGAAGTVGSIVNVGTSGAQVNYTPATGSWGASFHYTADSEL
ncbi:hypothetical protein [Stenotrophomonas sp.]|uniref:hypothetical protein n=1 Tax=Stenotrophomonas sp. TaxID=69392 RepID=UPI002898B850|nr:hypothetical protein [Stenotrophomonas sp.]